jgi:TetR/AcrR family fatty acid metabolism transcriptional regulator
MTRSLELDTGKTEPARPSSPPGRVKIMEALRSLLREKEFSAITWSEIARTAGVNEGLIYKYFKDRRNLLYEVLKEQLERRRARLDLDLKGIEGALNKLRKLIWSSIHQYHSDRVFSRILLLEVRSFPDYYQSDPYRLVKIYADTILDIIEEGVRAGEIRNDVSPRNLRQIILGTIEHFCLPGLIFDKDMSPDIMTEDICKALFQGFARNRSYPLGDIHGVESRLGR